MHPENKVTSEVLSVVLDACLGAGVECMYACESGSSESDKAPEYSPDLARWLAASCGHDRHDDAEMLPKFVGPPPAQLQLVFLNNAVCSCITGLVGGRLLDNNFPRFRR